MEDKRFFKGSIRKFNGVRSYKTVSDRTLEDISRWCRFENILLVNFESYRKLKSAGQNVFETLRKKNDNLNPYIHFADLYAYTLTIVRLKLFP